MKFDKKYISGKFPLIVGIAFIIAIGIIVCMVKTMTVDKKMWEKRRHEAFERDSIIVPPTRGNILSDDGQLMASSLPDYKVFIDFMSGISKEGTPKNSKDEIHFDKFTRRDSTIYMTKDSLFHGKGEAYSATLDTICNGLAEICPKYTAKEYRTRLAEGFDKRSRYFEISKGQVFNYIQFNELLRLPFFRDYERRKYFVGLTIEPRNNRKKPFGSLARRTLGEMYGAKDSARSGIELAYDSILRGVPGIQHRRKVLNKYIPIIDKQPVNGSDVVTTIDITMQDICENALREQLAQCDADMGVVILMEVKTGDVKAIVNLTRYDDGNFYEARNFALAALMEPGSTFKTASILVALDDGVLKPQDTTSGNGGVYNMYGALMKDHNWYKGGYGTMDVAHTLMYSSNIGVSRLIDARYHNCPEKFVEGLKRIGIGADLELPFVGSAVPVIRMPNKDRSNWSATALAWMSIGYETQIPPISTCSFYNAIANNGKMVKPRFVKAIQRNGEIIKTMPVEVVREQICRPEALDTIKSMLRRVISNGVGKPARSKHFTVAGKTGTAQLVGKSGSYAGGGHLVSFCGFFPFEDPKYTCMVAIRHYSPGASGGKQAGTVFKKVAESVYAKDITTDLSRAKDSLSQFVPEVKRGDINAARQLLGQLNIPMKGNKYTGKEYGSASVDGTSVVFEKQKTTNDLMPNLAGMGARDAIYMIESRGMKARISGCGTVKSQSVAAGAKIKKGTTVTIELD